jgi:hypothetical protein
MGVVYEAEGRLSEREDVRVVQSRGVYDHTYSAPKNTFG